MGELDFEIQGVEVPAHSVAPLMQFRLKIDNSEPLQPVDSILLRCQVQIDAVRRHYSAEEQSALYDVFDKPERWSQTVKSMLWADTSVFVHSFIGSTVTNLPVPCTFDFNVATSKFFHALKDGEVPLSFLFSGTVFYENEEGAVLANQISWNKEASYRLPVSAWKKMMDLYYPNTAWLCLRRDAFQMLNDYKVKYGIPTWEEVIERLTKEKTK